MNEATENAASDLYASLQKDFTLRDRSDLAHLVVPNGNGEAPVHRWFRMKEAYSCQTLRWALQETGLGAHRDVSVFDPFTGSGTTAISLAQEVVEGRLEKASFVGSEVNPYLHLVASTKLRTMQQAPAAFSRTMQRIAAVVANGTVDPAPRPLLSTFSNEDYFPQQILTELLALKAAIDREEEAGEDPLSLDLARICLGSIVESCSRLRRDGRALRYAPAKTPARPLAAFLEKAEEIETDLPPTPVAIEGTVELADSRAFKPEIYLDAVDLILFSPPYPNNIDYTEVYKLEAWLLDLYDGSQEFSDQRRRTLRSHASLDFSDRRPSLSQAQLDEIENLIRPILDSLAPNGRYRASRIRTIRGYAQDMLETLINASVLSRDDARLVYVVGNSLHGGKKDDSVLIAADLIIGEIARIAGFEVEEIAVARVPTRRRSQSPYLRESIVICRRTN